MSLNVSMSIPKGRIIGFLNSKRLNASLSSLLSFYTCFKFISVNFVATLFTFQGQYNDKKNNYLWTKGYRLEPQLITQTFAKKNTTTTKNPHPQDLSFFWWLCMQSPVVLDDQVIFCLTVSLDKLPVDTLRAKVRIAHVGTCSRRMPSSSLAAELWPHAHFLPLVRLWWLCGVRRRTERRRGSMATWHFCSFAARHTPSNRISAALRRRVRNNCTMRDFLCVFSQTKKLMVQKKNFLSNFFSFLHLSPHNLVSATLNVLPPPSVQYQQMTISGKHLIILKGWHTTKISKSLPWLQSRTCLNTIWFISQLHHQCVTELAEYENLVSVKLKGLLVISSLIVFTQCWTAAPKRRFASETWRSCQTITPHSSQ